MKRRIFTILGACYVAFALIMASCSATATVHSLGDIQEATSSVGRENHRSYPDSERLPGYSGRGENQVRLSRTEYWQASTEEAEETNSHGWIDLSDVKPKDIMATIKPNCAIVWTAKWCKFCKPMYAKVASLQKQGYTVYLVDYDEYQELGVHLKIKKLPTTIIYENRKEVKRHIGVVSEETIKKTLKKNQNKKPDYVVW